MAKSSSRRSLKSLFSRGEASQGESAGKDVDSGDGQRKRFSFKKFKAKATGGPAPETPAAEEQQVLSDAAEDVEDWADDVVADNKKSSLYATAPRSKGKELSYSELDLRKPKRFATFSFGLRKRKKKDIERISKSTFGLNSPGIEEQNETPVALSQMESDQADTKTVFSMSQPELDTNDTFDIPSRPPVATNQTESPFTLPNKSQSSVAINTQSDAKEPLTKSSELFDVHKDPQQSQIAAIPGLQLHHQNSSEEKENIPVHDGSSKSTSAVDNKTVPLFLANRPPIGLDSSDHEAALISTSNGPCDNGVLQRSFTKTETSITESTRVTLSHHQPDAPDMAEAHIDATVTESMPLIHTDNSVLHADAAFVHRERSISCTERSVTETDKSVTAASAVSGQKSARPVIQDAVFGQLYDSLFPQNFTSEVISSLLNPPPQICTETRHLVTKSEAIMAKTLNKCHTETNVIFPRLSDDAVSGYTNINATFSEREVISSSENSRFTSYHTSAASEPRREPDIHRRYLLSSLSSHSEPVDSDSIPHSERTPSLSEVKSDRFRLIEDTVGSVPVVQNSAPPISDYVTSQRTYTQVTDSKRRVVLVKELVTDEVSSDPGWPSPASEKMSAAMDLDIKVETTERFSAPSGQMERYDGPLSPTYLSIGSDDGSAMEIYYSAEEDNAEETAEEEMYTVDEREEISVVDGLKEFVRLHEELHQQGETVESGVRKRDEGGRVVIVKIRDEEGKMGDDEEEKEDVSSRTEVQQRLRSQSSEMRTLLAGKHPKSQEKEEATTAFLQVREEGQVDRKEELPATQVQQVNTPMVCDFAPPSSEPQGEGSEGNWTKDLETEDPPNGEKQLPSQDIRYLAHKDIRTSEHIHTVASSNTREEGMITPTCREEEEEQVSLTTEADRRGEVRKEGTDANRNATTSAVTDTTGEGVVVTDTLTHSSELQSDATEIEHNRAPQSSEWVDTITQRADRTRTLQEHVAVELSAPDADTHHPDTGAADTLSEGREHLAEAQHDLSQGSLAASNTPTAVSEIFTSENHPIETDREPVDEMNSGYSSLSTKLLVKNLSPPKDDEYKYRFRKVSLVSEADTTEVSLDTVDFSRTSATETESNGTDLGSAFKWRNRFEGVSQYKPHRTEDSSFSESLSYRTSDTYSKTSSFSSSFSSSSALPEATACKHLGNASASSPSPEEHIALGNGLNDRTEVHLSRESEPAGEWKDEWKRSLVGWEEPAAPAGEREAQREREEESERLKSGWDSRQLPVSGFSLQQTSYDDGFKGEDDDSSHFTGVFQATLVELVSDPAAPPSTPPASPDEDSPNQFDMDNLVDTLKSMGPSLRPRGMGLRAPPPAPVSLLPPIVEDTPSSVASDILASLTSPTRKMDTTDNPAESNNGLYTLPPDLGLKRTSGRDTRSPRELMKRSQQDLQQPGTRGLNLPLRASTTNSILMRKSSDSSPDDLLSPEVNGNGALSSSSTGSRLDNSVIFGSYRSTSIDQTLENRNANRPLFRTGSLPETGPSSDRVSAAQKELGELATGSDPARSRFDRFSFLLNSSSSSTGSLTGSEDTNVRISRPPPLSIGSPTSSNSPTSLLSPTGSIELHRPFTTTDSSLSMFGQSQGMGGMGGMGVGAGALGTPILQRRFSSDGNVGVQQTSLFNSVHGGSRFQSHELEPERSLVSKYRAFPDAYLTKEKEHGKLNPRPGKMYIFDQPGMCGQRIEVRSDVLDATPWELQETISIRVVRGGWVLYEKPNFKGEKIALDEGDIELTYPFNPQEEQLQNGGKEGEEKNGKHSGETGDVQAETKPPRRFVIGSLRRAVRDYSVPEISLFPEENAEGKKVIFRDTSEDARIFGFPIKANSIIINAGLWLVYTQPFFQGVPRVLEVGGYSNPAAWGVDQPYVASLHPLKVGEPRVEKLSEPKMVIYDKPYFTGKSRTITANMRDFITRTDRQQTAFMYSVASLKVLGGIWVGYEKEGFRGHQYLLEEGEYHDWRVWGGCNSELRSVRVIRADLTDPSMVMIEQPDEEEDDMQEENTFEVTEAIPDVELFEYKTSTRSIHVLSGAWVAYSHVDFSGDQYVLEKGFYNNCADWGSQDPRICSVQPILLAPSESSRIRNEVILYSEPDFQGECHVYDRDQEVVPEKLQTKSCRVSGGIWTLYEDKQYSGNLYVLSEGEYPSLTSMGCPPGCTIRSLKAVPITFSVPSISLFGLECLEGREITTDTEIHNMVEEGFNNHILSVRVNSGSWVICEHSNYRGRQFLLEPIEITNWPKFSSLHTIGSMFPVRQKRHFFRIKNKESGHFMSIQGGVEEMKSGRVVVTPEAEPMSDIWFYQDGFIKSKLSSTMSLQVMGIVEPGAKAVLWTETRQPVQTWTAQMKGLITSLTFCGMVLDVKGGKTYDKDHVVIMLESDERPSQRWEIELV